MKKILLAVMAVLFTAPTFAQLTSRGFSIDDSKLYYGIRIGLTNANISGDDQPITKPKVGFTIGAVAGLHLSEDGPVMLESGLYYTERGAKKGKQRVNYQNMEIPLLIKYGVSLNEKASILPFFGPTFSYAFWGETKQYSPSSETLETVGTFDEKASITGGLNRANLGIKLGAGIEYSNIYAEAGYHNGVTNICKGGHYNPEGSAHSNAFFVNVGVNF